MMEKVKKIHFHTIEKYIFFGHLYTRKEQDKAPSGWNKQSSLRTPTLHSFNSMSRKHKEVSSLYVRARHQEIERKKKMDWKKWGFTIFSLLTQRRTEQPCCRQPHLIHAAFFSLCNLVPELSCLSQTLRGPQKFPVDIKDICLCSTCLSGCPWRAWNTTLLGSGSGIDMMELLGVESREQYLALGDNPFFIVLNE